MIPVCKELGISEARDTCLSTFVTRVRENLHVVLCVSPVGDALRVRCRNFPSLINCTTIDWFFPWPEAALVSVAERFIEGVPLPSDEVKRKYEQRLKKLKMLLMMRNLIRPARVFSLDSVPRTEATG